MIRAGNEYYGFEFAAAVMLAQATVVEWSKVTELAFSVAAGTGTETKNFPVAVQENDIVVVGLACDRSVGGGTTGGGISAGEGYTDIARDADTKSPGYQAAYKIMGATPDTAIVIDQEEFQQQGGVLQVWRGVDTDTTEDATATTATGVGMPNCPSITTATDNARVFALGFLDDEDLPGDEAAPSGYGDFIASAAGGGAESTASVYLASKEVTSAGAEDPGAFGGSGNDDWVGVTFALRRAS